MNLTSVTNVSNWNLFVHKDWLLQNVLDPFLKGYIVMADKLDADHVGVYVRSLIGVTRSLAKAYQVCRRSGMLSSPQCYLRNAAGFFLVDSGIIKGAH